MVKRLVIIGLVVPEPASTAAGTRMLQLIDLFRERNYEITFLTSAGNIEFSEKIDFQKIEINDSSFDELINNLDPDIVLFDRFVTEEQFGWRVSENCPQALKILDTEDLHFLREARRKAFHEKRTTSDSDLINDVFKREIASVLRCDLSLIISEFEFELLTNKFRINPEILFYIPFLTENVERKNPEFSARNNFVSIGNFLHEPNWQTVHQLKKIWPKIRKKLPETELHIYGAYATEKVFQLQNEKEGFIVKGRAESVEKTFSAYRVLLAPIPFGAGLKGKLWESMVYGIPNVTSSIGVEAMHGNLEWNGFIEDSEKSFTEKAAELYQNEEIWNKSRESGYQILEKIFNKRDFENTFFEKIDEISENLQQHRDKNFLGQILKHHTLNSTKFMSKWIEEKNKKVNGE